MWECIERSRFGDRHADLLAGLAALSPTGDALVSDVLAGRLRCWEVRHRGEIVGLVAWTEERDRDGRVFHIDAAYRRPGAAGSATRDLLPLIAKWAEARGFIRLRFETERPGLVRRAMRAGYRRRHVLEADL